MRLAPGGATLTCLSTQRMPALDQSRIAVKKQDKQERWKCIGDGPGADPLAKVLSVSSDKTNVDDAMTSAQNSRGVRKPK